MTGCEVIYRLGTSTIYPTKSLYVLHKVRHDGMNYNEFLMKAEFQPMSSEGQNFATIAIADYERSEGARESGDGNLINGYTEISTLFPYGFLFVTDTEQFDFTDHTKYFNSFNSLVEKAEILLGDIVEDDGLTCSYGDYSVYVDFENDFVFGADPDDDDEKLIKKDIKYTETKESEIMASFKGRPGVVMNNGMIGFGLDAFIEEIDESE